MKRIRDFFSRDRRDRELDEEIQSHLAMAIRERVERGDDPRTAELAARREFGNEALVRETTRAMWGWNFPQQLSQDVRYAVRSLRSTPVVTSVVIASLALGIGANLALFSLVYSVMLRELPVRDPEQLVELLQKYPGEPRGNGYWTTRSYEFYRDHNHVFSGLTGTSIDRVARIGAGGSDAAVLVAESVVGNYFGLLGVHPAHGRLIGPGDAAHSAAAAAVVSWSFWNSRFGGHPDVLGKRVMVNDEPATIVGVAPRHFTGLPPDAQTDVWLPVKPGAGLNLIGRLKPDVSLDQARAEMKTLYRFTIQERAAAGSDPQVQKLQVELESARAGLTSVRDQVGKPLSVLMALVSVLLVLGCVNVAGILTAQAAAREREMALRLGLGASRGRLVRQVLTESCLLSALGTAVGVVVAYFGAATLLRILDSGRAHERVHLQVRPDLNLIFFAAGIAIVTGLLFGLAPALHTFRSAPSSALKQSGRAIQTRSQRLIGRILVVTQVALALVLSGAGALFITHLLNLKGTDLGFRRDHVLLVSLDPSRSGYRQEKLSNAYRELLDRLHTVPGVQSASLSAPTPLMGAGASGWLVAEGFPERPEDKRRISIAWVAPKYFETMMTPILAGREFSFRDRQSGHSAILSEAAAAWYFAGRDPIARRVTLNGVTNTHEPAAYHIIGVVKNANYKEIREDNRRVIYLPAFRPGRVTTGTFVIRTAVQPESIGNEVRRVVAETGPGILLSNITTLSAQIDASIVRERLIAVLSGFFAAVGALLAGIGLYGLLAYMVTRRRNEIGIRVALGATSGRIIRMILVEVTFIALAGLILGIPMAVWSRRVASNFVQDISTPSAAALGVSVAILVAVAMLASWAPATRAAHVDPMQSLRHE